MATNNRELLVQGAARLGLTISEHDLEPVVRYLNELLKWRRKVNLIARDMPESQVVENHFLDSLTLAPLLQAADTHLLDVGTGAGFPGLVLACVLPQVRFTLVEPRQKRVSFLRHVIRTLGLANTEVIADRIEPYCDQWRGRFTHITSRAVAEPNLFLPLIQPLVTPTTKVLLMVAHRQVLEGIESLENGFWRIDEQYQWQLPFSRAPRILAEVGRNCG